MQSKKGTLNFIGSEQYPLSRSPAQAHFCLNLICGYTKSAILSPAVVGGGFL